jgi:hypothetical protein
MHATNQSGGAWSESPSQAPAGAVSPPNQLTGSLTGLRGPVSSSGKGTRSAIIRAENLPS